MMWLSSALPPLYDDDDDDDDVVLVAFIPVITLYIM